MKKVFVRNLLVLLLAAITMLSACKKSNTSSEGTSTDVSASQSSDLNNEQSGANSDDLNGPSVSSNSSSSASTPKSNKGNGTSVTKAQANDIKKEIDVKGATCTALTAFSSDTKDGQRMIDQFKEYCNGKLVFITKPYEGLAKELLTMVMADKAPDIYLMTNNDFPSTMYKNIFVPLNNYIDFNAPQWQFKKQPLADTAWNGKNYFIPADYAIQRVVWYNKKLLSQYGFDDSTNPRGLFDKNQWTWNELLNISKKTTDTKNGVYGFGEDVNLIYSFLAAAGADIIKVDTNGIVNNVNSANVATAMNFIYELYNKGNKMAPAGDSSKKLFSEGKLGMYFSGYWLGQSEPFRTKLSRGEISFVPFPKASGSAEYLGASDISGVAIPKNTKQPKVAIAYAKMASVINAYGAEEKADTYKRYGFTQKEIQMMNALETQCKPVPIYSIGLADVSSAYVSAAVSVMDGTPWSTAVKTCSPKIDQALSQLGS